MALKNSRKEVHVPVQRLLETQTREQILSGELAPGARLPSTQELAVVWKTHPNTVQRALTPLVHEGLLTRIPRVGTFVRETVSKISRVGVYYDGDFWLDRTFAFYGALHVELQRLLRETQIELMVWVDPRNARDREKPWPALMEAAKSRAIQALILPDIAHSWLLKVPVPTACFVAGGGGISNAVRLDFHELTELSLQHLVEQGCRSVGMISADPVSNAGNPSDVTNADFYEHFVDRAKELGISHRKEWMHRPQRIISGEAHASFGYDQFRALWRHRERPEAVVVWPDSLASGVLMAISEQGLCIPRDLKLILHKNDTVDLFCPVAATYAVTRVHSVASALLEQIRKQSLGERCRPVLVPFQIQHTNAPPKKSESTLHKKTSKARIEVDRTTEPVAMDGHLDEAVWAKAKPIPFQLAATPTDRRRIGELEGKGSVRLLHDVKNLYIAFEFEDADVVDLSKEDDQELCTLGDVAEIFLKPLDDTWYWEFHVTPKGRISTYWWPGRGRFGLVGTQPHVKPRFIRVATRTQGTVNNWHDRDQGWTAVVAIPFANLDRYGPPKDPHSRWTILLSRYDYSRYRMKGTGPELSAASPLSEPNFHLVDEYPELHLRE